MIWPSLHLAIILIAAGVVLYWAFLSISNRAGSNRLSYIGRCAVPLILISGIFLDGPVSVFYLDHLCTKRGGELLRHQVRNPVSLWMQNYSKGCSYNCVEYLMASNIKFVEINEAAFGLSNNSLPIGHPTAMYFIADKGHHACDWAKRAIRMGGDQAVALKQFLGKFPSECVARTFIDYSSAEMIEIQSLIEEKRLLGAVKLTIIETLVLEAKSRSPIYLHRSYSVAQPSLIRFLLKQDGSGTSCSDLGFQHIPIPVVRIFN